MKVKQGGYEGRRREKARREEQEEERRRKDEDRIRAEYKRLMEKSK